MADKYNILSSIYQKTCKSIVSTPEEWLKFLAAASKNYRLRFEEMLKGAENELENTEKQFETAKAEVEKPFLKEDELKSKMARLDELNIILNLDKKENEIVSDNEPEEIDEPQKHKNKVYER